MFRNSLKALQSGSDGFVRVLSAAPGVLVGILVGLLIVAPPMIRNSDSPATAPGNIPNVHNLSKSEIEDLVLRALTRLGEQEGLSTGLMETGSDAPGERGMFTWKDIQLGVKNIRRLLPSVKRWTIEALLEATTREELNGSDWQEMTRLITGVRKIVRSQRLRSIAAVRDDRLKEILVDPDYAPHLSSDDEAVFVLAHELTHVAARSGKLEKFIERVAQKASRAAQVETTKDQREDLACDFVASLVLKEFIARNPNHESAAARVSRVLGYESPAQRFARAWEDFCASYNGDPGDETHLNQYQLIRALIGLDPQLQSLMPLPGNSIAPSLP